MTWTRPVGVACVVAWLTVSTAVSADDAEPRDMAPGAASVEDGSEAGAAAGGYDFANDSGADEYNNDPWEAFNRPIFAFNDFTDRWLLRPLAKGYHNITPDPMERGVSNFFANLREPFNLVNNLLQGKWQSGASDGGRLLVNTTLGVVGLFDVAGRWGLVRSDEDLGQTLGYWGVSSGPYLVVPLLGPRTLRDAGTGAVESLADPVMTIDHIPTRNQLLGLRLLDVRASLLSADELITGDRYTFLRDAYLQRRKFLVNDGVVDDDFGNDEWGDGDFDALDAAP